MAQDIESQAGSARAHAGGKTNGPMEAVAKKFPAGWDSVDHGRGAKIGRYPKGNARTFRGGGAYTGNRSFDNDSEVERESHGNAPNEKGTRNKRSVWTIATQPFPEAHFATFPEEIPRLCISAGSRVGDLVLDPFSGAGTTGFVALELGREYVGIERSAEYVAMSERRLRKVDAWQPSLLESVVSEPHRNADCGERDVIP